MLFSPRDARLTIDAETQIADIVVEKGHGFSGWGTVQPSEIISVPNQRDCSGSNATLEMPAQISGPFTMRAVSEPDGGLTVKFTNAKPGTLGIIRCGANESPAGEYLVLRWDATDATGLALQFAGNLTVGDSPSDMSKPRLLKKGSLFAEASSEPFASSRVSSETKLYAGDKVRLTGNATGDRAISQGVLQMGAGLIAITAHGTASSAEIVHIGQGNSPPQSVAPTFLARLQAQSQWGVVILFLGVLLHMLSALRDYLAAAARLEIEESIKGTDA